MVDRLVMLPPTSLGPLLATMFNILAIHSTTPLSEAKSGIAKSPSRPIIRALEEDHEVQPSITTATMRLFSSSAAAGTIGKDESGEFDVEWIADTRAMVREVGKGLIESAKTGKRLEEFLVDWKKQVSDWDDLVDITMLEVSLLSELWLISGKLPSKSTTNIRLRPFIPYHHILPCTYSPLGPSHQIRRFIPHSYPVETG